MVPAFEGSLVVNRNNKVHSILIMIVAVFEEVSVLQKVAHWRSLYWELAHS